jgi:hypothetical protein
VTRRQHDDGLCRGFGDVEDERWGEGRSGGVTVGEDGKD